VSRAPQQTLSASTDARAQLAAQLAPLSFAQERVWRLLQRWPNGPFSERLLLRLRGPLHVDALRRGLGEIVVRHPALRTAVVSINGRPMQCVMRASASSLPTIDLSTHPHPEHAARTWYTRDRQPKLDPAQGRLMQPFLMILARDDHVLAILVHHLAFDGWSQGLLLRELSELYDAFAQRRPPRSRSSAGPVSYVALARRERARRAEEMFAPQRAYWQRTLSPPPPSLELPTDYARPETTVHRAAVASFVFDAEMISAIRRTASETATSVFMVTLAAFVLLLGGLTGQSDLTIGVPVANRSQPGADSLIGSFVNMVVVRVRLVAGVTWEDLLRLVRQTMVDAIAHQELPFDHLLEMLHPGRRLASYGADGVPPLFRVCFDCTNNRADASDGLHEIDVTPVTAPDLQAGCDLFLNVFERGADVGGRLLYSTELFAEATARRFLTRLQQLLRRAVAHPAAPLSTLLAAFEA
jgi:hypothetical protein